MFDLNKLGYSICKGILELIDGIASVFYWFAGIRPATVAPGNNSYVPEIGDNTLFEQAFRADGISSIFILFAALGIGLLGIATVIGLIKTSVGQKDQADSKKKLLGKSVSSLAWVVAMPLIFTACVLGASALINLIVYALNLGAGTDGGMSLGSLIGKACFPDGIDEAFIVGADYDWFKNTVGEPDNYNYLMCILSGCCVLVGLFISCLTLVERIIHVVFFYLISPFVMAKTPLDDGKSFDQWKEIVMSKFLGLIGIIVCMYIFFLLMPTVTTFFDYKNSSIGSTPDQVAMHKFALNVAKIVFIIAGVFVFTKAGTLFAHLVSQGSGQFEGMSQGQSTGMLAMGARLAGGLGSKVSQGARMAAGGAVGGSQTMLAGGMGTPLGRALSDSPGVAPGLERMSNAPASSPMTGNAGGSGNTSSGSSTGLGAGLGASSNAGTGQGATITPGAGLGATASAGTGLGASSNAGADMGAVIIPGAGLGATSSGSSTGLGAGLGASSNAGTGQGATITPGAGLGATASAGTGLGASSNVGADMGAVIIPGAGLGTTASAGAGQGVGARRSVSPRSNKSNDTRARNNQSRGMGVGTAFMYGGIGGALGYGLGKAIKGTGRLIGGIAKGGVRLVGKLGSHIPFIGKNGIKPSRASIGDTISAKESIIKSPTRGTKNNKAVLYKTSGNLGNSGNKEDKIESRVLTKNETLSKIASTNPLSQPNGTTLAKVNSNQTIDNIRNSVSNTLKEDNKQ